jgi:hypothetical protein
MFLYKLPEFLSRTISYNQLLEQSFIAYYGKEMHFSAFLIYGLMFWFLSRHYDKEFGITGSKNIAYAASITLLSVAVFEWFWILSFATFQEQSWVATFRFPQAKILLQNLGFSLMGGLGILYMYVDSHILNREGETIGRTWGFRWTSISFILLGLSVALAFLWIIYPWPIQHIEVQISTGEVWTNSPMFPQTLYTIDIDPTDNMNAGVQYYVENNYVHGLNTLVKAVVSLAFCYVGFIKKHKSTSSYNDMGRVPPERSAKSTIR